MKGKNSEKLKKNLRDPTSQPKIDHVRFFHASRVIEVYCKKKNIPAPFRGAK